MNWENSVVKINVIVSDIDFKNPLNTSSTYEASGTGFFVSKKLILTCYHVVKYAINIDIFYKQNNVHKGTIKHIFPDDDLALIEIEPDIDDIIIFGFKEIDSRRIGDVFTVGFPLSSTNIKTSKGGVSGYQDSLIQTDASLNHGNSGGPLIMQELTGGEYKIIGVNVSKLSGGAERTGYVVPIRRFLILQNYITTNPNTIVIRKPYWEFDTQRIKQPSLRELIFRDDRFLQYKTNKIGIRVSLINPKNYLVKYFKEDEILISINGKYIDYNGKIKFDFFPERIDIDDINLWFSVGETLMVKVFNPRTQEERTEQVLLEDNKSNLLQYYLLPGYPKYYVEVKGLILSVITFEHLDNIKKLRLSFSQLINILNRFSLCKDLFTVYLSHLDYSKLNNFLKYPKGDIIIEINDKPFTNYEEFYKLTQENVTKIKTINNDIFYL
jgi:hypothetical protein